MTKVSDDAAIGLLQISVGPKKWQLDAVTRQPVWLDSDTAHFTLKVAEDEAIFPIWFRWDTRRIQVEHGGTFERLAAACREEIVPIDIGLVLLRQHLDFARLPQRFLWLKHLAESVDGETAKERT